MDYIRKIIRNVIISEGIINEEEKRMILYHGSPYIFQKFKDTTTFFSETEKFAIDYSEQKSLDYALDEEPNIYKVEVLTNLFDINNPNDYKLLASKLPNEVEYVYNNFGFTAKVDKNEILENLKGFDTIEPYKPAVKAKIGDEIPNPEYTVEKYIIVKKDNDFAYGYSKKSYQRMIDNLTTRIIDLKGGYTQEYKNISEEFQSKVKEIYSKDLNKKFVYDNDISAAIYDSLNNSNYKMTELSDDSLNEINTLYHKAIEDIKSLLPNMEYLKKFVLKKTKIELSDTWRFYENENVSSLIKKLGFGGYVAKERKVKTYAIFHPNRDVRILEYQFPQGISFNSWEDYQKYKQFVKNIIEKKPKEYSLRNNWDLYKLYKSGISSDEAFNKIEKNKEAI